MKNSLLTPLLTLFILASCTSQQKMAYLNNLPEQGGEEYFTMAIPDYKLQPRDILYITATALDENGEIKDYFSSQRNTTSTMSNGEAGGYLLGYEINNEGNIRIPLVGSLQIAGKTLDEAREIMQKSIDKIFKNTTVECKLLSFKFTVIGEVNSPGTYLNYNNYLTVIEAIGRAGGIGDFGKRNSILVIRPLDNGSKTYRLNLQDKSILKSEAYFLLPNDVVIVEMQPQKVFYQNLSTIGFIVSTVTSTVSMTLLLINFFK